MEKSAIVKKKIFFLKVIFQPKYKKAAFCKILKMEKILASHFTGALMFRSNSPDSLLKCVFL
jgi:hypothetical protein